MPQSKASKKHQQIRRLNRLIKRRERLGKSADGLQKELQYVTGKVPIPTYKTGAEAAGVKRYVRDKKQSES